MKTGHGHGKDFVRRLFFFGKRITDLREKAKQAESSQQQSLLDLPVSETGQSRAFFMGRPLQPGAPSHQLAS